MTKSIQKLLATIYVILGGAWGDCGKGKLTAFYGQIADLVIRATGGANAGHSVFINGKRLGLHLIPSGIMYKAMCLIGQGVVLDLGILLDEIETLKSEIPDILNRLRISGTATLLLPYHKTLDAANESLRSHKIGTTKRGIGPAYADKADRIALQVNDLFRPFEEIKALILQALKKHRPLLQLYGDPNMENIEAYAEELAKELIEQAKIIKPLIVDGHSFVREYVNDPTKTIVVEGAQSVRLSIETGDYPNCTSSDSNINGTLSGAHLSPKDPTEIIVVLKAYLSRVGNGPFPTEMKSHIGPDGELIPYKQEEAFIGDDLRDFCHEYGVSTGRPRRVGPFDAIVAKNSAQVSGADAICINCMDLIGEFGITHGEVKIAKSYLYQGDEIKYLPRNTEQTHEVPKPIYDVIEGGWEITPDMDNYEKLPEKAKLFIEKIEKITGTPVKYIGVGPENEQIIVRS